MGFFHRHKWTYAITPPMQDDPNIYCVDCQKYRAGWGYRNRRALSEQAYRISRARTEEGSES